MPFRLMRAALLGVIGVLLGASAQAQVYRGNDTGGIISWSCENEARWPSRLRRSIARAGINTTASPACIGSTATSSPSTAYCRRTSTAMRCRRLGPDRPALTRACGRC